MQRVAIYLRVSTERQSDHGVSLDVQRERCLAYLRAQSDMILVLDDAGQDNDGLFVDVLSGLETEKRAAYQRLLALARRKQIDVILLYRFDRLGRDDAELIARGRELGRLRVKILSATEGERDEFMLNLGFLLARRESAELSKRVTPALRKRAEQGLWLTVPPFGYRMAEGKKGVLEVYEPEARIVRELFRRAANGTAINRLVNWLNSLTIDDGRRLSSPRGGYFRPAFVRKVLTRPAYLGMIEYGITRQSKIDGIFKCDPDQRIRAKGQHEPIIAQELFDQVQAMLAGGPAWRTREAGRRYLLAGLVRCGICGGRMKGRGSKWAIDGQGSKTYLQHNYVCTFKGHGAPGGVMLDAFALEQIRRLPLREVDIADLRAILEHEATEQPDRTRELHVAKSRLEQEARKAADRLLVGDEPTQIERAIYRTKMAEIQEQLDQIEAEQRTLAQPSRNPQRMIEQAISWLRTAGDLDSVFTKATLDDQAAIIAGAIQHVTFTKTGTKHARRSTGTMSIAWQPWAETLLAAMNPHAQTPPSAA